MFSIYGVLLLLRFFVFLVSKEIPARNGSTFNADETNILDYMQENPQACNDGYTGPKCTLRCRYPSYGRTCQQFCNCAESLCNSTTGCEGGSPTFSVVFTKSFKTDAGVQIPTDATACRTGYTGLNCDKKCIYPGFGAGCQSECNCNVNQCDHVKGCISMHGFSRNNSTPDIGCLYPRYGKDCQMTCRCEEMFCNTRNGCIVRFYHFSLTDNCTSDKHHKRKQAMMFTTVILGVLAMLQFSVYFLLTWT
ncbi:cell death abnormality protein 1-like [Crassostrea angulata]|uniref:cell death abnormality protein 1-like n=1 Tax=Magallana angulata TaxID=2784310 RepID=UPI0022B120FA|nr:cell death abnormality protein 1-like [Crassostrea angulata]